MRKYIKMTALAALCACTVACDDYIDVTNHGGIPADGFITSVSNAQTALNGAYDGLYGQALYYYGIYYYTLFATNELENRTVSEEITPLIGFNYFDGSPYIANFWTDLYAIVARSNDVCTKIYRLRNSGALPDTENRQLDQMIGECNFLRGLAYFYLTRSFGDKLPSHPAYNPDGLGVPIVDTLVVSKQQLLIPRNTLGECWSEVVRDFETAYSLLPDAWNDAKLGAATKGAAAGYLGQVYMYFRDYPKAKAWFEEAMRVGHYELTENYAWNFDFNHENNSESIFEVQFQATSSYADLASYMLRRLGPNGKGYGMVNVSQEWIDKFISGYELTREVYDRMLDETNTGRQTAAKIIQREVLKVYEPYIGIPVSTSVDFYNLYPGDWNALAAAIQALVIGVPVIDESGWGTSGNKYVQAIRDMCNAADPRMYDSFYVPNRDSISLDWAETQKMSYDANYYGFKKYIPYNLVESWASEGLPYADGFNSINQRIFRLADLYLQYAEACYRTGDDANAEKYLNRVRRRAWRLPFDDASMATVLPVDFPSAEDDPGDFMKALIAEREKELCLEGHLWFDFLRWNKAAEVFAGRGFDPEKHHRLPIPYSERQIVGINILLQNSGY
jgi:tetratricopeptide (TPR) repeat protein